MTKTYLVHAWCDRPFITYLDQIEAATPEEAIAIARGHPKRLIEAAEECNGQYLWDEFAVYDEEGNELLHILDDDARLEIAAPELLAACTSALKWMAEFYRDKFDSRMDNDPLVIQLRRALANANADPSATEPVTADRPILTVSVRGGLIEDMEATMPLTVVVEDWDVPEEDTGRKPTRSVHDLAGNLTASKAKKLRHLIAKE
jgi:hypothetical protein